MGTISISNDGAMAATDYSVSVVYNGVPVEELIAAIVTNAATDITNAITSTFNGFTLNASLNDNSSTIALSGVTNTDKTTSGGTPVGGELRKTTTGTIYLPSGYEVTTASGTDYDFTDPDGSGTAAYPATALAEGQLIIAERDGSGDIVSGNSETYTVTLELEALQQLEAADLSTALSGVTLTVAYNPTPLITVNGLTNACSTLPCDDAETALGAFTVTADTAAFTLAGSAASVDVNIEDQDGAATVAGADLGDVTITRVGDGASVTYTVQAAYSGAAVTNFVTAATLTAAITPVFNNSTLISTLAGSTISLSGKNAVSAAGELVNGTSLPAGYEVTATDGTAYTFTDPDGASASAYSGSLADLMIAERTSEGVVNLNQHTYTINITLSEPVGLRTEHLSIRAEPAGLSVASVSFAVSESSDTAGSIVVNGITNSCDAVPCHGYELKTLATLSLDTTSSAYTIHDYGSFVALSSTAELTIKDISAAQHANNIEVGELVLNVAGTLITYTVYVNYLGYPVSELIELGGGLDTLLRAGTEEYNGLSAASLSQLDIEVAGSTITISGFVNTANDGAGLGELLIERSSANFTFASGYSSTVYDLIDPTGTAEVTDTGNFVVAEGTVDGGDIVAGNQVTYTLNIIYGALPLITLSAADIAITMTTDLTSTATDSPSITISPGQKAVIIKGVKNYDGTRLTLNPGSISLTAAAGSVYAFTTTDITTAFADAPGTALYRTNLGTFTVSDGSQTEDHTLYLDFRPTYNLLIDLAGTANDKVVADGETLYDYAYESCEFPNFTVYSIDEAGATNNFYENLFMDSATKNFYYLRYEYISGVTASGLNTHTSELKLVRLDHQGSKVAVKDDYGNIRGSDNSYGVMAVVSPCTTFSGAGTAASPYIIDTDARLDALAYLLSDSAGASIQSQYESAHYKLTTELNMSHPNAPWTKDPITTITSLNNAGRFEPIGHTYNVAADELSEQTNRFSGTFDCDGHTISNLYMERGGIPDESEGTVNFRGLFGVTTNATIKNCTLANVDIEGYNGIGVLVGYAINTTISNVTIVNSSVKAYYNAGGMVGELNVEAALSLKNNAVNNTIISNQSLNDIAAGFTGGMVGRIRSKENTTVTLENNRVGSVSLPSHASFVGGLVGGTSTVAKEVSTVGTVIISNSSVIDVDITALSVAGGLLGSGRANLTVLANTVTNISIYLHDTSESSPGGAAGGLIGEVYSSTIDVMANNNTVMKLSLSGYDREMGGLIGLDRRGGSRYLIMTNNLVSNAYIEARGSGNEDDEVGGIAGELFRGEIVSNVVSDVILKGTGEVGGIVGKATDLSLSNNMVMGTTLSSTGSAESKGIGGIVGFGNGVTLEQNFVAATIEGAELVSGFVSKCSSFFYGVNTVKNTYFKGSLQITGDNTAVSIGACVKYDLGSDIGLTNTYSTGSLTIASGVTGTATYGMAFPADSGITLSESYWNSELYMPDTADVGEGKTTSELQSGTGGSGSYSGWDTDIWDFGTSSEYPALKKLPITPAEQRSAPTSASSFVNILVPVAPTP